MGTINTNIIRNSKGLTLVEIAIAMALVAVVSLALIASVTQSAAFSRKIDIAYSASQVCQRRIENLNRMDFSELELLEETDVQVDIDGYVDSAGHYSRTTEVDADFDGNQYLKKVKVSVKKAKVFLDGSIGDPQTGDVTFIDTPVVMETIFVDEG